MSTPVNINPPKVQNLSPELPEEILLEIGFFAADWAAIEQNLIMHVVEMCGREPAV